MTDRLLDEAFLAGLAGLRVISRGRRKGRLAGLHASPRTGVSVEFADYRDYSSGDDFRYIDWNVYGRLNRLLVKSFVHEADLPIYLLVDLSASMRFGHPSKVVYASRLAVALAYLGLRGMDRVGLYPFTDRLLPAVPPRHGMGQMTQIVRALERRPAEGRTHLNRALDEFASVTRETGLVFLLTDFLSEEGHEEGLARLLHRGDELVAFQILSPQELEPSLEGSVLLSDVETGRRAALTVGRGALAVYGQRLQTLSSGVQSFLADRRSPYFLVPTDLPIETLVHEKLRGGGILR
ncbi:MAG: DUF58 domain-containing protein [Candidatus Bipolaricaulota bacterium]